MFLPDGTEEGNDGAILRNHNSYRQVTGKNLPCQLEWSRRIHKVTTPELKNISSKSL